MFIRLYIDTSNVFPTARRDRFLETNSLHVIRKNNKKKYKTAKIFILFVCIYKIWNSSVIKMFSKILQNVSEILYLFMYRTENMTRELMNN